MKSATLFAIVVLSVAACASSKLNVSTPTPSPDPRVGLRAGWMDAAQAAWNIQLVSTTQPSPDFINRSTPGDFNYINSDISFTGPYVIQGNFAGIQVWDITDPKTPRLQKAFVCPGSQSDVSVYRKLLFVSGEALNGRTDCGTQGVRDTVSHDRLRGIRIFDVTDIANPRPITQVQTCRGSHTHTVVTSPADTANVYIYVSGSAPVRSSNELAGCSSAPPDSNPNSALFRIEVIQVPLAHPEQARIVSSPRIFQDLVAPPQHGEAPEDVAAAAKAAAEARAKGGFTAKLNGAEIVLGPVFVHAQLDSIVKTRGGSGAPTAADSAVLRTNAQVIVDRIVNPPTRGSGPPPGPTQCHDITVYPAIGLAGGACGGYGLLLDIRDVANPKRLGAVADSNFSYWHSATFNNDGTKILFTDEWGGGLQPRCRATDKPEWGADAIFTRSGNTMTFQSYYKLPAPQTKNENCVAHNGTLIPIPGRDIMIQAWYQGGISLFDWTDPAHPREIGYFDRGPMDSTKLVGAGSWSAYWYNGYIVSSEISRGLDIFELRPSAFISQNEIDAAKLIHFDYLNAQDQQQLVWPASFVVARAYLDQLARSNGLAPDKLSAARTALAGAERLSGQGRR
ncbi:MAG TPA: hypothetical protein VE966_03110, partial [Gemmatimonadales bacterium]|nr:hypothetical protein [Gemmatimonadales bacterium]